MSDVGLGATLELSITQALNRVEQLGRALDQITSVTISADVSTVSPEITRAVEAADTAIVVTGDATELTGEVNAALDAADTSVTVDVDVDVDDNATADLGRISDRLAGLTGEQRAIVLTANIKQAEQSLRQLERQLGDESLTNEEVRVLVDQSGEATRRINTLKQQLDGIEDVSVEADTTQAQRAVRDLGREADTSAGATSRLRQALAGIGAAAIAKGLFDAAQAASNLAESTSKATAVFGDGIPIVQTFAREAADSIGLSEQAALEAAGTFGNLFQALGVTQQVATDLSPKIITLAADLASFGNLGIEETLEKLRSGLIGEVEPLRGLGISFNAAQVEAKAFELGLAAVGEELTEGDKLQARYQLITEQSSIAAGDFARTSEGLANQQRKLTAEFQNAVAAAGQELLPTLLDLVTLAREDLIPGFGELAENVLPALASIFSDLAPLLGTSLDLLVLMSPALGAIAAVLDLIPPDLIAFAGGLVLFNRAASISMDLLSGIGPALRSLPGILQGTTSALPAATSGVGKLGAGMRGLAGSAGALSLPLLGAAAAGFVLFKGWQDGRERAREFREGVEALTQSLETLDGITQLTSAGIAKFAEESEKSRFQTNNQEDDLRRLGLSYLEVANLAQQSASGLRDFVAAAQASGEVRILDPTGRDVAVAKLTNQELENLIRNQQGAGAGAKVVLRGNTDLITSFRILTDQVEEAAKAQIETALASGDLTQAQVDQARGMDESGEATRSNTDALNELEPAMVAVAREGERLRSRFDPLAAVLLDTGDALDRLGEASPAVALNIARVTSATDPSGASLVALAVALDTAGLSEADMGDAALALGTDLGSLQGFVEQTTTAVQGFVDAAVDGLPSIADAFEDANDDSKVSAREFIAGLKDTTSDLLSFISDLNVIITAGFSEVAGTLAAQGVEVASTAAHELAEAARAGNEALLLETQAGLDERDNAIAFSTKLLEEKLGPEYVDALGLVGTLSNQELATRFTPEVETRIKMGLAQLALSEDGRKVAAAAATAGGEAARRYGETLGLDAKTTEAAVKAGEALRLSAVTSLADAARAAARSTGDAYVAGLELSLSGPQSIRQLEHAAETAAEAVDLAVRRTLGIQSPSRAAMEIGDLFGQGLVLGIEATEAAVAAAAEALGLSATAGLTQAGNEVVAAAERITRDAVLPVSVSADITGQLSGTSSAAGGLLVQFGEGSIVVSISGPVDPTVARQAGQAIADGMAERLAERRLAVTARAQA